MRAGAGTSKDLPFAPPLPRAPPSHVIILGLSRTLLWSVLVQHCRVIYCEISMSGYNASGEINSECESVRGKLLHEIFVLAVPNDHYGNWGHRSTAWFAFFYLMLIVFGIFFVCLGVMCVLLLWKRHLAQRFRVKTFIAIDLALMTLGFSRAVVFVLDPWGQSGYFTCRGCIIVSRLIAALGFPSLTASYTLVFITLWLSAKIQLGPSCVQNLKLLVPLCFVHYVISILFEIIGSLPVSEHSTIFLLLGCEAVFTIWGFLVCFGFLFAGIRLLKAVKSSAKKSSMVCKDSPTLRRQNLIENSRYQDCGSGVRPRSETKLKLKSLLREHHKRAIRKVTLITYVTATLGMVYSIVGVVNLTLISIQLVGDCPGYISESNPNDPEVWLTLRYVVFTLEVMMAILLTYSISEYQPVMDFLLKTCCRVRKLVVARGPSSETDNTLASQLSPKKFTEANSFSVPNPLPETLEGASF